MESSFATPQMTMAVAMLAGVAAQVAAEHARIPGIVLLLATGVLLGPDVAGIVQPSLLGDGLLTLVGFAVAVILFEGGMNLQLSRLRREGRAIQQLITLGAVVTAVGASLAAKLVLEWDWRTSILFGTLVIVTGPTVITPLLRRFKVEHQSATVLEAEGVLIDAVGAVVATVALEVALAPSRESLAAGVLHVPATIATGTVVGLIGGFLIAALLKPTELIPDELVNVFTLTALLGIFQLSNALIHESGIAAATACGIVVGNAHTRASRELHTFKEQLTALFIGMLFVLLAADVRLVEVEALGLRGVLTIVILIVIVRPLSVAVGTLGTELSTKQRLFASAIGPRGIVAAAVAAFFAAELKHSGVAGGGPLRALVFLAIVMTVLCAGLLGGPLARYLGLQRASDNGWVVLGAHALARLFARLAKARGHEVLCIDTNPVACDEAEKDGLRVIYGNGLKDSVLARAALDTRKGALAMSANTEVNLLFSARARARGLKSLFVAIGRARERTSRKLADELGASVLFGRPAVVDLWDPRLREGTAEQVTVRVGDLPPKVTTLGDLEMEAPDKVGLVIAHVRDDVLQPAHHQLKLQRGDELVVLLDGRRSADTDKWLSDRGFVRTDSAPAQPPA